MSGVVHMIIVVVAAEVMEAVVVMVIIIWGLAKDLQLLMDNFNLGGNHKSNGEIYEKHNKYNKK